MKNRNIVVYLILIFCITGILLAWNMGQHDDANFATDSNQFIQAENDMNNSNFSNAFLVFENLLGKYPNNAMLLSNYGICLAAQGDYTLSLTYLDKAKAIRPFLLTQPNFLAQYGQDLYLTQQYSRAKKYLLRCKQFSNSAQLNSQVDEMLSDIAKKLGKE